jgi:heptosyltransferase-1
VAADTGPLHLAAALGTPVVALFGPTDPARNGPVPKGTVLRHASEKETTYRRGENYSPAMLALGVEEVAAAVERELSVQP